MKKLLILTVLFALVFNVQAQEHKLKKQKIAKLFTIELPKSFDKLNDDEMAQKYTTINRPLAVYADKEADASFSVVAKPSSFASDDLDMLYNFYKSSIQQRFSAVNFMNDGIRKVNGREFVTFEFVSSVKDERKSISKLPAANYYTIAQYTIVNNQLYIMTFSVPAARQREWQKTAQEAMSSVKF
ncbi:MAG: hypothetical protein LPK19_04200 [Hymenobacteraceae bacterium]|nr:hypothetical protein [Hymenobacteraceae bacterium]MDX5395397.1 hypothetical protein [Hymenobacteraceae bacterium]MDX5511446.1 hypothetical protein [Hymenobacteraceae bacterium]